MMHSPSVWSSKQALTPSTWEASRLASLLGRPDIALLGMSEMIDDARRIVQAIDLPVIAEADTGYGNPTNVIRTVREYEVLELEQRFR
jgi:2-methylisocitrate lyase-like PEP mutase family enzyme